MKGAYILADYPDKDTFYRELNYLMDSNVDFIEVGIPFNDPVADGPVIAKALDVVAERGYDLREVISNIREIKKKNIYFMTYSNIIYHYGVEQFSKDRDVIDGFIIADLPNRGHSFFYNLGLTIPIINFVTPESKDEDIVKLKDAEGDFIYFVGIRGTTGGSVDFTDKHLINLYTKIKEKVKKKVILGFGVKTRRDVEHILSYADGFVIGTEIVKRQDDFEAFKRYVDGVFY